MTTPEYRSNFLKQLQEAWDLAPELSFVQLLYQQIAYNFSLFGEDEKLLELIAYFTQKMSKAKSRRL